MSFQLDDVYVVEPSGTRICQIRSLRNGEHFFLRAKGNVSLVDFFGPGGQGHGYTVHIQTAEGKVDLPVKSNTFYLTDDTITLCVPPEDRHLLNNIETGTRFILAFTRLESDY